MFFKVFKKFLPSGNIKEQNLIAVRFEMCRGTVIFKADANSRVLFVVVLYIVNVINAQVKFCKQK